MTAQTDPEQMVAVYNSYDVRFADGRGSVAAESESDARARVAILFPGLGEVTEVRRTGRSLTPKMVPTLEALLKGERSGITHYTAGGRQ
jgi:hypothetical protein